MKKALLLVPLLALSACQYHKVSALRVESQFGNPIGGATVGMYSMNSGHPIYPNATSGGEGLAHLPHTVTLGPSYIFSVSYEGRSYHFDYNELRWDKSGIPTLRLKNQY